MTIVRDAECVTSETEYRLDVCRAIYGAHIDIY
jgi:hypothetical protein